MPQLAAHQLIGANFSFQHFPFDEVARTIRGFGLLEIELWGIAQHLDLFHATDARVESVRRVLADNELSAWCFTPEQVLYPINIASGDAALRQDSIERFWRAADICAALGARYLFLTPGRGYESEPRQPAWDRAVGSIGEIARRAAANGVRCLLEPLQRFESNLVNNAAGLRQMLDEVGAGNVDVVLDTVAMATAGDTVAGYVDLFGSRLAHVHLVDGTPGGHLVWGEGTLPLDHYVSELARLGYAGKFTFEPFGNGSYALDPVKAWTRCLGAIAPYIDRATVPA
ncbi:MULTISPECIES: sugar phosphate isomerase/epimerase family protein [unclassified Mesorhizobium]|uniref:sugar phosphate isomerase/epimerase family protein n=1 Tax=unclassified Mesorhizobium TaxID=325217 RepID=UPI0003CEB128|nr:MULTISPECIES: sugar phosphate isomerase/epimerase family protein [unclassified Mesorhizobium]ESY25955.1 AP endonuclease [Mesorhizobium sp. LNJC395A00]WJI75129.1 sugar phosphate isomerase/epimerase [Mesorhizobium sp. C395A]